MKNYKVKLILEDEHGDRVSTMIDYDNIKLMKEAHEVSMLDEMLVALMEQIQNKNVKI